MVGLFNDTLCAAAFICIEYSEKMIKLKKKKKNNNNNNKIFIILFS